MYKRQKSYGAWQNWLVALITLVIVTVLNHYGKGVWKLASILIGIIGGYIVALFFGMIDFSSVAQASFFQLPKPMHVGIKFEPSACVAIGILFAINAVQAIGDFSATTTGSMDLSLIHIFRLGKGFKLTQADFIVA